MGRERGAGNGAPFAGLADGLEPGALEVSIVGKGFLNPVAPHHFEAHRIDQGEGLVAESSKPMIGGAVQEVRIGPDHPSLLAKEPAIDEGDRELSADPMKQRGIGLASVGYCRLNCRLSLAESNIREVGVRRSHGPSRV